MIRRPEYLRGLELRFGCVIVTIVPRRKRSPHAILRTHYLIKTVIGAVGPNHFTAGARWRRQREALATVRSCCDWLVALVDWYVSLSISIYVLFTCLFVFVYLFVWYS